VTNVLIHDNTMNGDTILGCAPPDVVCINNTQTVDTTAPTIANKVPNAGATGVAVGANVEVTFSEPMDPTTITNSTFRLVKADNKASVTATVSYDAATNKATLDPNAELKPNTTYEATVITGVKDIAGNALAGAESWQFTTGAS
jgi:hypothetical protein